VQNERLSEQAAVLIAIAQGAAREESILLTLRAQHLSAHSGEVAFPGGKKDEDDTDLLATALRETYEEVGLAPSRVKIIEQLPVSHTYRGVNVTPFVGLVDSQEGLRANDDELQSLFWVPMDFLKKDLRTRTDIFHINGQEHWSPVYDFDGYRIWGFTARVLVEFLNRVYALEIGRENAAPEITFNNSRRA